MKAKGVMTRRFQPRSSCSPVCRCYSGTCSDGCAQVTTALREISPADYDAALLAAPDDCPLLCVAGDRRSGAQLLEGLEEDARHAARAVGSACWAEQLDRRPGPGLPGPRQPGPDQGPDRPCCRP